MTSYIFNQLRVYRYTTEKEVGLAAAQKVALQINKTIEEQGEARIILATGTSQFEFLAQVQLLPIQWNRVTVFHLDEYVGLKREHPASFQNYLASRIINRVQPQHVHFLNGNARSIEDEMNRYALLLNEKPIDIACVGIGENGHLAFNDPGVADFNDPKEVKCVPLDLECRQQQYNEGWFPSLESVPKEALTLTVPMIMKAKYISCVVPHQRKAKAVSNTLQGAISEKCPASILCNHPNAVLFTDLDSASLLNLT